MFLPLTTDHEKSWARRWLGEGLRLDTLAVLISVPQGEILKQEDDTRKVLVLPQAQLVGVGMHQTGLLYTLRHPENVVEIRVVRRTGR